MVARTKTDTRADQGSLRALVVEDDPIVAESLGWLLTSWGYEVKVAYDGFTALTMAHAHHPDVALIDLGLPKKDGYLVALELRRQPALKDMLLIAVTGHEWAGAHRRSQEYGFDHHLVKPVGSDDLKQLLASLDRQRRAEQPAP
jgi:CheY-like chemotaxis protein